jgi:outer membrane protein TolC
MLEEHSMKHLKNAIGRWTAVVACACVVASGAMAQERRLTIQEAVDLALRANHSLRAASYQVSAEEEKRRIAKSNYFPSITNESNLLHITDLQRVEVPAGAFGAGIPTSNTFLSQ